MGNSFGGSGLTIKTADLQGRSTHNKLEQGGGLAIWTKSWKARGDNSPISAYDIAVIDSSLSEVRQAAYRESIDDIDTLKKIDIVFIHALRGDHI